jgi:hypothetical protein
MSKRSQSRPTLIVTAAIAALEGAGLVFWMLAELVHDKNESFLNGLFLWIAMCFFLSGGAHGLNKAVRSRKTVWSIFALLCVVLILPLYKYARPKTSAEANFTVLLSTDDMPSRRVPLTNDFLRTTGLRDPAPGVLGYVFVPLQLGKSNVCLQFWVINDSPVLAEHARVVVSFPKDFNCAPDAQWAPVMMRGPGFQIPAENPARQSWVFGFPVPLLPGEGAKLPPFFVKQAPLTNPKFFSILLRAKDCTAQEIEFSIDFLPIQSNAPPHRPFAVLGRKVPSGTNLMTASPQDILDGLKRD